MEIHRLFLIMAALSSPFVLRIYSRLGFGVVMQAPPIKYLIFSL